MIRGGLALNNTGFILVQTMCPTSSLSRLVTLLLTQVLKVCSGVTNKKEKDGGVQEVWSAPARRAESDRSSAMS